MRNLNYIGQITDKLQHFEKASPYRQNSNCARCNFLHKFLRGKTMKRKFKLITSVASLCLAIALMAFGVYAASAPKLTVSGTVSFNAENVYATVTIQKGKGATLDDITLTDVTVTKGVWTTGTSNDDAKAEANVDETLDDQNVAYKYVVTIKNDFKENVSIKGTFGTQVPALTADTKGAELVATVAGGSEGNGAVAAAGTFTIAAGETATITVTLVIDPAVAAANISANLGMVIDFARVTG